MRSSDGELRFGLFADAREKKEEEKKKKEKSSAPETISELESVSSGK